MKDAKRAYRCIYIYIYSIYIYMKMGFRGLGAWVRVKDER